MSNLYQISGAKRADAKCVLDGKRLFVFDMDGTIYLGSTVFDYAVRFIHIVTPFYLLLTVFNIMVGALRGIGDSAAPTLIMLSSFVVFRQIYLAVTKLMGFGFLAVALAYPMGWLLCCLLVTLRYMKCPIVRPRTPSQGSR